MESLGGLNCSRNLMKKKTKKMTIVWIPKTNTKAKINLPIIYELKDAKTINVS